MPRASTDMRQTRASLAGQKCLDVSLNRLDKFPAPQADASTTDWERPKKKARVELPAERATPRANAAQRSATASPAAPQRVQRVSHGGYEYKVGDCAYVVTDVEAFNAAGGLDEGSEYETCEVCHKATKEDGAVMLECDTCLRGFHTTCLRPRLPKHKVPEGEWLCASCTAGEPPPPQQTQTVTLRQKLLGRGAGLAVVRLEALWKHGGDSSESGSAKGGGGKARGRGKARRGSDVGGDRFTFSGRWYCLPEDTCRGRQAHHNARELMLTQLVDTGLECDTLLRPCAVVATAAELAGAAGDDVFVCDHIYDTAWERFRPLVDNEEDGLDGDAGFASDEDGVFEPERARDGRKHMHPSGRRSSKAGRCANRHAQGARDWGLGAAEIPAAARQKDKDPLWAARTALATTSTPAALPCRDAERAFITRFVETAVTSDGQEMGQCLYIYGVPGTGKTATVMDIMRSMRRRASAGELPRFQFVEINGLRLSTPQHAYTALYEAMTGEHLGPKSAVNALEELFLEGGSASGGRARGGVTLVLVDEMDLLLTRKQKVLYNLFQWPLLKGSRLAVIGISNTHDLPDKFLPRIASRLAGRRLGFSPYSRDQLRQIVAARLEGIPLIDRSAVSLITSKVSSASGDVRRCLELCSRAIDLAAVQAAEEADARGDPPPQPQPGMVTAEHAQAAYDEIFDSVHMFLLLNAPPLAKVLLAAILQERRATGVEEVRMEPVAARAAAMLLAHNQHEPALQRCIRTVDSLAAQALLDADPPSRRLRMRIRLNVDAGDVRQALLHDGGIPWMQNLTM